MKYLFNIFPLILILSQVIFSLSLKSEVLIYKLNILDSQLSGITKTFQLDHSQTPSEISMLGWIQVDIQDSFNDILEMKAVSNIHGIQDNSKHDLIFFLQYLNWSSPQLKFGYFINDLEEKTYFELSAEEHNSWIFVYLGHSFEKQKQTYYLKSQQNEKVITQSVSQINNEQFYQALATFGYYRDGQFIRGKIERLVVQTGQGAYREKDFAALHAFHPDTITRCPVGFDQCGFLGYYVELCGDLQKPKSVLLQGAESVVVCADHQEINIKKNIDCIEDGDLGRLQIFNVIDYCDNSDNQCEKKIC